MTLRTRLILTIAGIALLLVLPAVYGIVQHARLREIATVTRNKHANANLSLGRLQARVAELDRVQRSYIATLSPELREEMRRALANARVHLTNLGAYGYAEPAQSFGERLDSIEGATNRIEQLVETGQPDAAAAEFEAVKPLFAAADSSLSSVAAEIDRESSADLERARTISDNATTTTLLALIICLVIAVLLAGWATRTIFGPVRRLRRGMAHVADGNFVVQADLPYDRQDEIGDVARSFRWMTEQLAELDRLKAEFMSIAAHELKTPINVISGYAELMQEGVLGELTEKQGNALESIREQSRNLTVLVNELLDLSRLEAGGLQLEMEEVHVRDLFASLERAFSVLCDQKHIVLRMELADDVPPSIPGDVDRLRDQVLGNLMANAVKFTPEDGMIDVKVVREGEQLHTYVSDNGGGIPPDQLAHVFEKYYQVGGQARSKGAGLGLAIAREIVEAHGGTISVESEPARGTTFCVALPITLEAQQAAVKRAEELTAKAVEDDGE